MRTRVVSALLVVLLVSLAGCNGVFGGNAARTATLSPAPVPTEAAPVPPGVVDDRLVDTAALLGAHASQTTERSYTAHRNRIERYADGTVRARTDATARRAADGSYRVTVASTGTIAERTEYYFDGTDTAYFAADFGDRTAYSRAFTGHGSAPLPQDLLYFGTAPYRGGVASQRGLFRYVSATNGSAVAVERPTADRDYFRYRVRTESMPDPAGFAAQEGVLAVENLSISVTFDRRGFVRRYAVSYRGQTGSGPVRVEETVTYAAVGETTVERPDWPVLD